MTTGLENGSSLVLNRDPSVQAVFAVKVGKVRELSTMLISSSSRGGIGMVGSAAMIEDVMEFLVTGCEVLRVKQALCSLWTRCSSQARRERHSYDRN